MYLTPSILSAVSASEVGVGDFISVSLGGLVGVGGVFFAGFFSGFLIDAGGFGVGGAVGSTAGFGAGCSLA